MDKVTQFKNSELPIYIKRVELDWQSRLFDLLFLLRIDFYKNNPRGYFHWIQAFWLTIWLTALTVCVCWIFHYIFGLFNPSGTCLEPHKFNFQEAATAFTATVSIIFARNSSNFRDQWKYCAEVYNDIQRESGTRKEILYTNLCLDLMLANLWAHRSYRAIFKSHLVDAFEAIKTSHLSIEIKFLESIDSKVFEFKLLENILSLYVDHLKEEEKRNTMKVLRKSRSKV